MYAGANVVCVYACTSATVYTAPCQVQKTIAKYTKTIVYAAAPSRNQRRVDWLQRIAPAGAALSRIFGVACLG